MTIKEQVVSLISHLRASELVSNHLFANLKEAVSKDIDICEDTPIPDGFSVDRDDIYCKDDRVIELILDMMGFHKCPANINSGCVSGCPYCVEWFQEALGAAVGFGYSMPWYEKMFDSLGYNETTPAGDIYDMLLEAKQEALAETDEAHEEEDYD